MATPHISAEKCDIASTVLMPGDPLRSRLIAENFFEKPVLFNDVRGVQGYTGFYKGVRLSVMASGMGMPSMNIYSHELFNFFDVDNIIRVGTIGSIREDVKNRDVVIAMSASTNSAILQSYGLPGAYAPTADYSLLRCAADTVTALGERLIVGNVYSTDIFYNDAPGGDLVWQKMGVIGVEMEAAVLYANAAMAGKRALAMMAVTDELTPGGSRLSADERVTTLNRLITAALETAVAAESENRR